MDELGLCPLVKKLYIHAPERLGGCTGIEFSPEIFDDHILLQFSALTNIRELSIHNMDISSFLPTVRSLALNSPRGSSRQIVFFIELFPHLEDLKFTQIMVAPRIGPSEDPMIFPPSIGDDWC